MAKFKCKCGEVLDLVETPADCEFTLVKDKIIFELVKLFEDKVFSADKFYQILDGGSVETIICRACSRIWLKEDGSSFTSYIKED